MPLFPPGEDFTWQDKAACTNVGPNVFFPVDSTGRSQETPERVAQAKGFCADCPVADVCLEYALRAKEKSGVWGGLTTRERRRVAKLRVVAATEGAA